jgi:hypothetical protein
MLHAEESSQLHATVVLLPAFLNRMAGVPGDGLWSQCLQGEIFLPWIETGHSTLKESRNVHFPIRIFLY